MKSAWQSTFVMITKYQSIGLAYMIWLLSCSWLLSKNCLLWLIAILQSTKHLHFHHQMQPHPKDMIKDIRLMTLPTYIYMRWEASLTSLSSTQPQVGHWDLACLAYFAQRGSMGVGKLLMVSNPCRLWIGHLRHLSVDTRVNTCALHLGI